MRIYTGSNPEKGQKNQSKQANRLCSSSALGRNRQLQQQITDFVHIAYNAIIAVVKNRGVRVLVDRCDTAGVRESRDVIDSAGNPETEQQLWLDDRAGLSDYKFEREKSAVKNRARAGELSTEPFCASAITREGRGIPRTQPVIVRHGKLPSCLAGWYRPAPGRRCIRADRLGSGARGLQSRCHPASRTSGQETGDKTSCPA